MSKIFELHGEEIKRLRESGKTAIEISEILGIGKTTVRVICKKHGFTKNKLNLSEIQEEYLIANIIGDGCLFKNTPTSNARMNLAHSLKQEIYFMKKYEVLKEIIRTEPTKRSWVDKRTGNEYHEIRFQSKVNSKFTELWSKFYKDGKKIIPKGSLDKYGEILFSIKYFDDGSKNRGNYTIAMCDYDDESIKNFMLWIKQKFNMECNVHKNKVLYFPINQSNKFYKIIKNHVTEDMLYKL